MTILSCKTIFGLTFSAILENLLESFFRKVPKTVILAIFWHVWPKSAKMRIFIKNRAVLFFYPYCPPTSCQVSEKSLERFPRSIRYIHTSIHTSIHTYKGEIIEPVAFAGSIYILKTLYFIPKVLLLGLIT